MPKAVLLDLATISREDIDLSPLESTPYEWEFHDATAPDQTQERIKDAELVVTNKVVLDRAILDQAPTLKKICIAATGTNNVDLEHARELGITVTNVAGYSTPSVVQHVFALILSLTTKLPQYQMAVGNGDWQRAKQFCLLDYPITELNGKSMGIIGYGALGRAVAKVAEAFGLEILIAQRPGGEPQPGRIPIDELLPQVDILSLHCPLSDNTRDLIGAKELAAMKPGALLINTARGGIVDEPALAAALRTGEIAGAGMDVLAVEPPKSGSPLLAKDIPNLILTPHTAWASQESRQRLINEVGDNIRAFLSGIPRNRVG